MAELLSKEPLFNGKTEFDQLDKVNISLVFHSSKHLCVLGNSIVYGDSWSNYSCFTTVWGDIADI